MIKIGVNNKQTMEVKQTETGEINVTIGYKEIDTEFNISEADFVMLMNYYQYQKSQGLEIM